MDNAIIEHPAESTTDIPKVSEWLWRPWYAKLWWAAIPVWWLGMAVATRVDFLAALYGGALAGYLNILFFPMTALMVLGVGYARERLDNFVGQGVGMPLTAEEEQDLAEMTRQRISADHERMMNDIRARSNPLDPRSGPLWIGNTLNPNNPAYINPHGRKHH
ncbi:hypothetical protein [Sphingobium sp.]|uniref:hypothetical protein n=1 Tax=Sphingobium sp. TaxID=1912891 RepID=UPI000DAF7403|nr:hypothetical protein [Sphingobium sp.]PZU64037.1 MAG: hypothetical protein DI540_21885 [Sphingobium sp.]